MRWCDVDEAPERRARWNNGAAPHQLGRSCSNLCKALSTGLVKHQYCSLTAEMCFITGHYRRRYLLPMRTPFLLFFSYFKILPSVHFIAKG